jgi:hypothetical protein
MKKVFDILPPKKQIFSKKLEKKQSFGKFLFIFFLLVCGVIFLSFHFSRAKINLWLKSEDFFVEKEVILKKENADIQKKEIPLYFFEFQNVFQREFMTTGKVQTKAEGKIRLYNAYTQKEEVWLPKTRFISADGKIFKSKDKIIVPGAKLVNDKLVPSFVDVEVEASEPGEEYNIPPTKFAVLAFKGTDRYTKYWAESYSPFTGGGERKKMTKEDLERAKKENEEKLKEDVLNFLKEKIGKDYLLLEDLQDKQILQEQTDAKVDSFADSFKILSTLKIFVLAPKKEELKRVAEKIFEESIPEGKVKKGNSLSFDLKLNSFDLKKGEAKGILKIKGKVCQKIERERLKEALAKKEIEKGKEILQRLKIEKMEIKKFPPFLNNFPKKERIEISIFD